MTEASLHNAVADFLAVALPSDVVWTTVEHGYSTSKIRGAKLKRRGVRAGWPDIQLMWPAHVITEAQFPGFIGTIRLNHVAIKGTQYQPFFSMQGFIELKSPRGRLSAAQKAVHADLRRAGVRHLTVCRSVDEVSEALQRWGIELRARV